MIFTYFSAMNNSGKLEKTSSTSFYCIIPLQEGTSCKPKLFETTNPKRILRSSHQKNSWKTSVVNVLALSLKYTYKYHFVGLVAGRVSLKTNFFVDTVSISTLDQRCFNIVDHRWNNVDSTLKIKQYPELHFQRCKILIQCWCLPLKQR